VTYDIQVLVGRGHGQSSGIDVAASGLHPGGIGPDWAKRLHPHTASKRWGWPLSAPLFPKMSAHVLRPAHCLSNSQTGGQVVAKRINTYKAIVIFGTQK